MTTIPDIPAVTSRHRPPEDLSRFAWLSIAAAIATILLKTLAWQITGSVGLLSDAAESLVNLVAAIIAPGRVEGIDPSTGHESPIRSLEGRVLLSRCRGNDDLHRRRGHRIQRC